MSPTRAETIADLFYKELLKITRSEQPVQHKIDGLSILINRIFIEATQAEKVQFSTAFSRSVFVFQKFQVKKRIQFWLNTFRHERRKLNQQISTISAEDIFDLGIKAVGHIIRAIYDTEWTEEVEKIIPSRAIFDYKENPIRSRQTKARVVLLKDDPEQQQFIGKDRANPEEYIRIAYNVVGRNENFAPTIKAVRKVFDFPINCNLIDVAIDKNGVYKPRAFVLEPDYLFDVSAIAECFKDYGTESLLYLLKKYIPVETNKHLMIGNIANFFLDELMTNPDATFQEIFPKVFQLNPLAFAILDDREIREIQQKSQKHFNNLKNYVLRDFKKFEIIPEDCFLEPSFFSETYGLQGRLDAFYHGKKNAAIVELKSGKPWKTNAYGINNNHFTQTLLYDLIIRSVFENNIEPVNYILYSGVDMEQLKYAPVIKAQQFEALQLRNLLLGIERTLEKLASPEMPDLFLRLNPNRFEKAGRFTQRDCNLFFTPYYNLSDLEKRYFRSFSAFIAREHRLAKIGVEGVDQLNGHADLWRSIEGDKELNFNLLGGLKIIENKVREEEPMIEFKRTTTTNPLANFRSGDIAVLYPKTSTEQGVLRSQIYKCTIVGIDQEKVTVRLRSKQYNTSLFDNYASWNLEHDMMDSGFNAMYRSLHTFSKSPADKRDMLLTLRPPKQSKTINISQNPDLTQEQNHILEKAISAEEYFLLWGPPGTGKTSKMLKYFTEYILKNTDENLLLLAYTNRAVDEICASIESIGEHVKEHYLRIGSKYSTSSCFHSQLLSTKTKKVKRRSELRQILENHRIFVSTVASFGSKQDLLKLKNFNRVVIDEASQILEPTLVGLLPNFERFILIGDHKQLPAVVMQSTDESATEDQKLNNIGLTNLRNSYFERLYKQCMKNSWDWAFARLSHQGRMHEDIMRFPNIHFYGGFLKSLPDNIPHSKIQKQLVNYSIEKVATSDLLDKLSTRRTLFFNTEIDPDSITQKTNRYEAQMIGDILELYCKIYESSGRPLTKSCIGIITPYRAQIAQIQEILHQKDVDSDLITIDTVERYQGGARDIILISLCTNSIFQIEKLVSLSEEGVDRKLNVALTRAREHVVLVGNEELLTTNSVYEKLANEFR